MPALKARDIRDLTFHVTVLRHDHTAAEIILQTRAGGVRHLPRGLSRRDAFQRALDRRVRQHRRDGVRDDFLRVRAQVIHRFRLFLHKRPSF